MKPFLQGRKTLSISALKPPTVASSSATIKGETPRGTGSPGQHAGPGGGTHGEANVEVVKEGDKVVRLIVTCSCGERVEIECLYAVGS